MRPGGKSRRDGPGAWRAGFVLGLLLLAPALTVSVRAADPPTAVPTFQSVGLYWSPDGGSSGKTVTVRYRKQGTSPWTTGHPLWFDSGEYRGSLVQLTPGTAYQVELSLEDGPTVVVDVGTWSESFPIGQTVTLPASSNEILVIETGGTANGYVLYAPAEGESAVIDVDGTQERCIEVDASYVIVRGLTLRGGFSDCIRIEPGRHDVIIEDNDISGWGNADFHAAIRADYSSVRRIVIQRNHIHDPRHDSNSWCENEDFTCNADCDVHPAGPNGIRLGDTAGNHVVRYNSINASQNWLQDGIALGDVTTGGKDTDIHGNRIENVWDNGIEAESDNTNVRIWGNFIDHTYSPLGLVPTGEGPLYIWRNVFGFHNRKGPPNCTGSTDADPRGRMIKAGDRSDVGGGRVYIYHNTVLHAPAPQGLSDPLSLDDGITTNSSGGNARNMVARNNILYLRDDALQAGGGNDYDHDLYHGEIPDGAEPNGTEGVAVYDPANGPAEYFLADSSPGHDAGTALHGFNAGFVGDAPDMGAFERGAPPLEFGRWAYRGPTERPDPPDDLQVE